MKGRALKGRTTCPTCENLLRIGDSSLRLSREQSFPLCSIWQAMAIQKTTLKNSILKTKTLHPRSESLAVDHLRPRPRKAKSPPNKRAPEARQKDHPALLLQRKETHTLPSLPGTHLLFRTSWSKRKTVEVAPRDPEHPLTLTGGLRALTSGPRGVSPAANSAAAASKREASDKETE